MEENNTNNPTNNPIDNTTNDSACCKNGNKNLWIGLAVVLVIVAGLIIWAMNGSDSTLIAPEADNGVTDLVQE
ncbi:hypothetical protein KKG24_02795 [Patescibacteria group bacterium]|nr:hypothetical protein [Patescibacteria group bacterium]